MAAGRRWPDIAFFAASVVAGIAAGTWGHSLIAANDQATDIIVTVFSILAGFLIAVMTLLGDQSILPGSWRIGEAQRTKIRAKLIRQKWLFYVYLLTLTLIFVKYLLAKSAPGIIPWLERTYFGFAVTAFLLSFRLPATLMQVQVDRIDAVIGVRRQKSSKLDRS